MHTVHQSQLPFVGMSYEFVGAAQSGVAVSFFLVNGEPGRGTRLHKHDYDEVVYVIEGRSTWTVNGQEQEAHAGMFSSCMRASRISSSTAATASCGRLIST